jgi:hypothetical protein
MEQSVPRARLDGVGNSHGFGAAARSGCFASLTHHSKNDLRPLQDRGRILHHFHASLGAPPGARERLLRK